MKDKIYAKFQGLQSFIKASRAEAIKANLPRSLVLADMLFYRIAYGYDALDYQVYGFAKNRNSEQRKSFMSSRKWAEVCNLVNASTLEKGFDMFHKSEVAGVLREYFKRDIVILNQSSKEELLAFLDKHPSFFAKQDMSYAGKGVFSLHRDNFKGDVDLLVWLRNNHITLLEESIEQHPVLDKVSPGCVATLRLTTVVTPEREVLFFSPLLRMGEGEVGHIISGQFYAPLDEEGIIFAPAYKQDGDFNLRGGDFLSYHPFTGEKLLGFKLPHYSNAKLMCREMALKVQQYPFIGWDLAITEEGPVLLEGNKFPANDIIQVYAYNPQQRGLYYEITQGLGL